MTKSQASPSNPTRSWDNTPFSFCSFGFGDSNLNVRLSLSTMSTFRPSPSQEHCGDSTWRIVICGDKLFLLCVVTSLTVVITDRLRRIAQTKHRCDELRTYTPPRPHHNKTESLPAMDPTRHRRTRRGVRSSNKLGRWGRGGIGLSLCRHVRPAYCMVSPRVWCHHTTKLHAKLGFTARLHASGG